MWDELSSSHWAGNLWTLKLGCEGHKHSLQSSSIPAYIAVLEKHVEVLPQRCYGLLLMFFGKSVFSKWTCQAAELQEGSVLVCAI